VSPAPRKVLVTGASGFIGGWAARGLVERGYAVRALYRRPIPPADLKALAAGGAEIQRRDLTEPEEAREAVRGAQAVVHAAALASDWGDPQAFRRQNVTVTRLLLEQARAAGCQVFVFLGSISVHGFGPHVQSTEKGPYYPLVSPYQRTKKEAEEAVLAANAPGFRTTVLRPADVYGPGDRTTFYRLLQAQERGIRGTLGGGLRLTSLIAVEDLVQAIALALESEAGAGQVFNLCSGEPNTWRQLLGYTASLLGVRPWFELPLFVARPLAALLTSVYRFLGIHKDPPLTPYRVEHVAYDFDFSIEKAQSVLGFSPAITWRDGLARTVAAYRAERADFKKGKPGAAQLHIS
jgi:nucleoside-diphosphate-sugar epimerase